MASNRSDLPDERPGDAVLRLRHELLRTTDRAVGAEAEAEALRRTVAALHAQLTEPGAGISAVAAERDRLRTECDRLRNQINAMYASTTWRTGRLLTRPAARVRRAWRRR